MMYQKYFFLSILFVAALTIPLHPINKEHPENSSRQCVSTNKNCLKEEPKTYSETFNSTFYCAVCEFLINQGDEFLSHYSSDNDAIHFMENLCDRLPKSKQMECDEFVRENYHLIIEMVLSKETPHHICSKLHFCEDYDHQISDCDFCRYATHRIERYLSMNNTLTDIVGFGNTFCNTYRSKYIRVCNNVIPYYYSHIIGKLIDQYSFTEVCKSISLCH